MDKRKLKLTREQKTMLLWLAEKTGSAPEKVVVDLIERAYKAMKGRDNATKV